MEEAYQFDKDVYPNIAQILRILSICPASGAVVERGFSLMNMQMNKLHLSMKIRAFDALMRIYYILPIRMLMILSKFCSRMETDALTCNVSMKIRTRTIAVVLFARIDFVLKKT